VAEGGGRWRHWRSNLRLSSIEPLRPRKYHVLPGHAPRRARADLKENKNMATRIQLSASAPQPDNPAPLSLRVLWSAAEKTWAMQYTDLVLSDAKLGNTGRRLRAYVCISTFNRAFDWGVELCRGGVTDRQTGRASTVEEALDTAETNVWKRLSAHERVSLMRHLGSATRVPRKRLPPRWDTRLAYRLAHNLERETIEASNEDLRTIQLMLERRAQGLTWTEISKRLVRDELDSDR
jgi:hypothetical protein